MGLVPVTNTQTMAEDSAKPKGDPDTKNSADTKDSADPAFWETRYRKGVTPWEPVLEAEGVPLGVVVDDGVGSSYV